MASVGGQSRSFKSWASLLGLLHRSFAVHGTHPEALQQLSASVCIEGTGTSKSCWSWDGIQVMMVMSCMVMEIPILGMFHDGSP